MGQNAVASLQGQAVEGHIPRAGGVFCIGDLIRVGVQKASKFGVKVVQIIGCGAGGFIPADLAFKGQVCGDGMEHRVGHQRCTGIVEMHKPLASGGIGADGVNIYHGAACSAAVFRAVLTAGGGCSRGIAGMR